MASHWYDQEGNPRYTVPYANGKGERDTNLGDARKLNLVPSVTTIMSVVAKPALDRWLQEQLLKAVLAHPYHSFDDVNDWKKKIYAMSKQEGKDAAERGSEIHDALEHYYLGEGLSLDMHEYCAPVIELIEKEFGNIAWVPEASFSHKEGFGGKCDLHFKSNDGIILDFKTKSAEDFSKVKAYPEQAMQLVAYRMGFALPKAKCYNLFISTKQPGALLLHEWAEKECENAWQNFRCLLQYWKGTNNM